MQPKYRRVSAEQRCQIQGFLQTKISAREMSSILRLHVSTIYREIRRNKLNNAYKAREAQRQAIRRRRTWCRRLRILENKKLVQDVIRALKKKDSPELIAHACGRLSHQTIYNEIRNHRPELRSLLPRFGWGRGRKRAHRAKPHPTRTMQFLSIKDRPKEANDRSELGHWERDFFYVKDRQPLIVVQDRLSRYVRIAKANKKSYGNIPSLTRKLTHVDHIETKSITNDNGTEFFEPEKVGVPVFFCDSYSPQQRGSIENVIGRIRDFLPKTTDFNEISWSRLRKIEHFLNHRPRKCLGFRTPHEVLFENAVALAV